MRKILFLTFTMLTVLSVSAQENKQTKPESPATEEKEEDNRYFITHKVAMGEQVIMISKKYMVDPRDIYKYNKEAVDGISAGTTLMIPLHKSHKKDIPAFIKTLEKENRAKAGNTEVSDKG